MAAIDLYNPMKDAVILMKSTLTKVKQRKRKQQVMEGARLLSPAFKNDEVSIRFAPVSGWTLMGMTEGSFTEVLNRLVAMSDFRDNELPRDYNPVIAEKRGIYDYGSVKMQDLYTGEASFITEAMAFSEFQEFIIEAASRHKHMSLDHLAKQLCREAGVLEFDDQRIKRYMSTIEEAKKGGDGIVFGAFSFYLRGNSVSKSLARGLEVILKRYPDAGEISCHSRGYMFPGDRTRQEDYVVVGPEHKDEYIRLSMIELVAMIGINRFRMDATEPISSEIDIPDCTALSGTSFHSSWGGYTEANRPEPNIVSSLMVFFKESMLPSAIVFESYAKTAELLDSRSRFLENFKYTGKTHWDEGFYRRGLRSLDKPLIERLLWMKDNRFPDLSKIGMSNCRCDGIVDQEYISMRTELGRKFLSSPFVDKMESFVDTPSNDGRSIVNGLDLFDNLRGDAGRRKFFKEVKSMREVSRLSGENVLDFYPEERVVVVHPEGNVWKGILHLESSSLFQCYLNSQRHTALALVVLSEIESRDRTRKEWTGTHLTSDFNELMRETTEKFIMSDFTVKSSEVWKVCGEVCRNKLDRPATYRKCLLSCADAFGLGYESIVEGVSCGLLCTLGKGAEKEKSRFKIDTPTPIIGLKADLSGGPKNSFHIFSYNRGEVEVSRPGIMSKVCHAEPTGDVNRSVRNWYSFYNEEDYIGGRLDRKGDCMIVCSDSTGQEG